MVAFLSVGSKAAGFALAIRLLTEAFPSVVAQWHFIFAALAILSMVLGNVVALAQTSMKRMLAYSSIGQAGFVMIGFVGATASCVLRHDHRRRWMDSRLEECRWRRSRIRYNSNPPKINRPF